MKCTRAGASAPILTLFVFVTVVRAQSAVTTLTLGRDQIGLVKTAPGITTKISFPERIKDIVCGDLYDSASGKGIFVMQPSGKDIFLKPIKSSGASNLFVKTGERGEYIYNFDLSVVPVLQAHRIVNVVNAQATLVAGEKQLTPPLIPPIIEDIDTVADAQGEIPESTLLVETPSPPPLPYNTEPLPASADAPSREANKIGEWVGSVVYSAPPGSAKKKKPASKRVKTDERKLESDSVTVQPGKSNDVEYDADYDDNDEIDDPETRRVKKRLEEIARQPGRVRGPALKRVHPIYPVEAERKGISEPVKVIVTISKEGIVTNAELVSGPEQLADAALQAALAWKFAPTLLNGQPVEDSREIVFNFRLPQRKK